jgi:AcrR family transcriptional regulator
MIREAARPGRRPNPARGNAIRAAVVEILASDGYAGLTMDAVAVLAGVSKATIYRRWPTKTELLVSVIDHASDETLTVRDTGSLRDDLVHLIAALADILGGPGGAASRALLFGAASDPAIGRAFRSGPMDRWGAAFGAAFRRAVDRGELTPDAATSYAAESGPGILVQRWTVGRPIDPSMAEDVVDEVVLPLIERYRPG